MHRIPIEKFNVPGYSDPDVLNAWKWFMSFISAAEWRRRKKMIEDKITYEFKRTSPFSESLTEGTLQLVKDDMIGWYLYLLDMLINEPHKYEYFQGVRVVPIFKRFGTDLELLKTIKGVERRIRTLLRNRISEADAILFEILTALLWARNGYQVEFIEEEAGKKNPDIRAFRGGGTWNIECKRQSKTSDYAYRETTKRQKMISHISRMLIEENIILDIVFHVEIETLPDTFLLDLLKDKLRLAIPGKIISDSILDIWLDYVDLHSARKHLQKKLVKNGSPLLNHLIGKKPVDNKAFTCGMHANFFA